MRFVRRNPVLASILFCAIAAGCGDTAGCGCGEQPLAEDMDEENKVYDGILVQVTPQGFDYIEQNFTPILETFLAGGLTFDLPPDPGCNCSGQAICQGGTPCPITANLHDIALSTVAPDRLRLDALVDISSGSIPVQLCAQVIFCFDQDCDIRITVQDKAISADVVLGVDPLMKTLTFDIENVAADIQGDDFQLDGNLLCDIADWDFIKNFIAGFINGQLQGMIDTEVQNAIDGMTCMECGYFTSGCDVGVGAPATCDDRGNADPADDVCVNPGISECVRKPMGMVGEMDLGALLGGITGGQPAPMELFLAPGQQGQPAADPYIAQDGGPLDLRVITGAYGVPSPCVPAASSVPSTDPPPRIDFAAEAAGDTFMAGVGVSDRFLDKFFYELYQSGGLCLNLSTATLGLISTGLFKTFLSSLDSLTEGGDWPMILALRPKDRPYVDIGAGTYRDENGTKVIEEPLLTVYLPDLHMDFYAMVEERFVRLFTLKMDIALPLALELTPQNELVPILGDLGSLVTNIEALNSEILAEDPAVLRDIIPAIIGLVEPVLADALAPIALPDLQGFGLVVKRLGGMVDRPGEPGVYEHMGILADLLFTASNPAPLRVDTDARVVDVRLPPREELRPQVGERLPLPEVVLEVAAWDARVRSPGLEWQYRIDEGFWSPFSTSRRLSVRSPKLLLQGRHVIDVRARSTDDYRTLDSLPARVEVVIDWEPPTARLEVDPATGIARVHATDRITSAEALEFAFSVDGGAFSGFANDPEWMLPIDATEVTAKVRDESGNEKTLTWVSPQWIHGNPPGGGGGGGGCGCSGAPPEGEVDGRPLALALGLFLLVVRRRRQG